MASPGETPPSLSTSVEPIGDGMEDNEPEVDAAAPDTRSDAEENVTEDIDAIDGETYTRETILNTACIIFSDFTATFIAFAVISNIDVFGKEFLLYDPADVEKSNLIVNGVDAVFFLLTGFLTDLYGNSYKVMTLYSTITLVGTLILPLLTFNWSVIDPSCSIPVPIRRITFYTARIILGFGFAGINTTAPPFAIRQIEKYGVEGIQSCFHYIYMARNCCPNLCSSVQTVDDENVELLSKSALKSTSTAADLPNVEDPSITLAATVDPWGEDSVDETLSTEPPPTSTSYGTVEVSAVTNGGDRPAERMKPAVFGMTVAPEILHRYLPLVGIALAPVFDIYVFPYISKNFITLTMPTRIKIGIILTTLSVLAAAIVETARMMFIERGDSFLQEINNQTITTSNLTLASLIPQYVLMAAADVFVYISSLEFAFRQSPRSMQAIATGIFLFYATIGQIVAILIVPLINTITTDDPWYPHEINDGHLNYYFLVLTAISLTNLIMFCLVEKFYKALGQFLSEEGTINSTTRDTTISTQAMTADKTTTNVTTALINDPATGLPQPVLHVPTTPSTVD
ncbi:solute carrier family 15 member 4-like [Strongylocentrotus purpuratus]|uniref:Uncharacterized protein n=1 Tax=Strongylocentrotus purpuratus TaxID=7668 RepID=A0A7M7NY03_STRPU|nr:solute carrier family 15 member 4-like [Strongylocentrotus purpuratus]